MKKSLRTGAGRSGNSKIGELEKLTWAGLAGKTASLISSFCRKTKFDLRTRGQVPNFHNGGRAVQFVLPNLVPSSALLSAPNLFTSFGRKWKWGGCSGERGGNRQWTQMNANGNLTAEIVDAGSVAASLREGMAGGNLFTSFCRKWKRGGNRQWTQMHANGNLTAEFVGFGSVAASLREGMAGGNLFTSFCRISFRPALCPLRPAPCSVHPAPCPNSVHFVLPNTRRGTGRRG